ncbi:unnamed protein product [Orchesella dallaii]|uniref:Heparan-alpha-glucosaminide N-acetyltransferase n=1 Tax=Orchesella dallaii TaxID=48710 RepID=A0ABP1R723_9HEXA
MNIGYLGPGGLHRNNSISKQCVGGTTGYVDRLIFGQHHIHNRPTSKAVYDSGPFDPEGLLGVLTSLLQIWLGVQAGLILLTYRSSSARVYRFLTWSAFCGIVGLLLCGGFKNEGWIPVNKNLW